MEELSDSWRDESTAKSTRNVDWKAIADSDAFVRLEAMRRRLTIVLLGVFAIAFGTFLVLCAYARPFMRRSVDGGLTVAYVWLLCLTVLAWVLAWVYLRVSQRRLEPAGRALVEAQSRGQSDRGR